MVKYKEEKRIVLFCLKKMGVYNGIKNRLIHYCNLWNKDEEKPFIMNVISFSHFIIGYDNYFNKGVILSFFILIQKSHNNKKHYFTLFWRYLMTSKNQYSRAFYEELCIAHIWELRDDEKIQIIAETLLKI